MSKYEWERGEIILPTKVYSTFRRKFIEAWNTDQTRLYDRALRAHDAIQAQTKIKRDLDQVAVLRQLCGRDSAGGEEFEAVGRLLFGRGLHGHDPGHNPYPTMPVMGTPKKKDLDVRPVSRGGTFNLDEASISFDDVKHSVTWDVLENNHACERAHEHPLAKRLFTELGRVEWTRGSGGQIVSNDEYNRDSRDDGGGSNYVVREYKPKSKSASASSTRW